MSSIIKEQDLASWQERSLMVRSILRGGPIELFLVPTSVPRLVLKTVICGMMHIKETLLLIRKGNPCGGSGFPLSI